MTKKIWHEKLKQAVFENETLQGLLSEIKEFIEDRDVYSIVIEPFERVNSEPYRAYVIELD